MGRSSPSTADQFMTIDRWRCLGTDLEMCRVLARLAARFLSKQSERNGLNHQQCVTPSMLYLKVVFNVKFGQVLIYGTM